MNWDAIGAVGEIVGALAVFVTLLFLAIQIRESNKIARSAASAEIMNGYDGTNEIILDNPHMISLMVKLKDPNSQFTPEEEVEIEHYCYRLYTVHIQAYTAFQNGQVDEDYIEGVKQDVKNVAELYPGLVPIYRSILERYPAWDFEIFDALRTSQNDA